MADWLRTCIFGFDMHCCVANVCLAVDGASPGTALVVVLLLLHAYARACAYRVRPPQCDTQRCTFLNKLSNLSTSVQPKPTHASAWHTLPTEPSGHSQHSHSVGAEILNHCIMTPKACRDMSGINGVTRRKLQTPGIAEEHKRQETPTINPIGPTDAPQRPSTKHYQKESPGDA